MVVMAERRKTRENDKKGRMARIAKVKREYPMTMRVASRRERRRGWVLLLAMAMAILQMARSFFGLHGTH